MEQLGYRDVIQQEYDKISKKEEVTKVAQITINNLCDFNRKIIISKRENYSGDVNTINYIASTKINTFLLRAKKTSSMYIHSTEK